MRAIFGVLSLLIVLAIVGSLAIRAGSGHVGKAASSASAGEGAGTGTLVQQSKSIQDKARDDTVRALQQGAERTDRAVDSSP